MNIDLLNKPSPAFARHRDEIQIVQDVLSGTRGMREAGQRYIPVGRKEPIDIYNERVKRTVLLNTLDRTLNFYAGQVFQEAVVVGSSSEVEENKTSDNEYWNTFAEDVDLEGSSLTTWSSPVFISGNALGVTFCLVDHPSLASVMVDGVEKIRNEQGELVTRTAKTDKELGARPYLVHIPADAVIDAPPATTHNTAELSHFRYKEIIDTLEEDTLKHITIYRIRSFFPDRWEVWESIDNDDNYVLKDKGTNTLGYVPVCMYKPGEPLTATTARPSIIDLAYLSARHFQATCGHYDLMEYVRRPPWFGRMLWNQNEEPEVMPFGPGTVTHSTNESSDLKNIGIDAASVLASERELQKIEENMAMYGLQQLQSSTGNVTATESQRMSQENNSTLRKRAVQFQDFLENCLQIVAEYTKGPAAEGPVVKVNTDFGKTIDYEYLRNIRNDGAISHETFLSIVKGAGYLPDNLIVEEEIARVNAEKVTDAKLYQPTMSDIE